MKSPRYTELPPCCENHLSRWLPVPETDEERAEIAALEDRWSEDYYLEGWYEREDLPEYVKAAIRKVAT